MFSFDSFSHRNWFAAKLCPDFRASALRRVLKRLKSGRYDVSDDDRNGIIQRVNELINLLESANDILHKASTDALALAACKLSTMHYISGIAWHSYLAAADVSYTLMDKIDAALRSDAMPVIKKVSHLLAARPGPTIGRCQGSNTLICAACGSDAVTFLSEEGRVSFNRLSPVNGLSIINGRQAEQLQSLMDEGKGQETVEYLLALENTGFDNYCPDCKRVFCKDHFAVETEWSGSWHTATFATCPIGHRREIE